MWLDALVYILSDSVCWKIRPWDATKQATVQEISSHIHLSNGGFVCVIDVAKINVFDLFETLNYLQ